MHPWPALTQLFILWHFYTELLLQVTVFPNIAFPQAQASVSFINESFLHNFYKQSQKTPITQLKKRPFAKSKVTHNVKRYDKMYWHIHQWKKWHETIQQRWDLMKNNLEVRKNWKSWQQCKNGNACENEKSKYKDTFPIWYQRTQGTFQTFGATIADKSTTKLMQHMLAPHPEKLKLAFYQTTKANNCCHVKLMSWSREKKSPIDINQLTCLHESSERKVTT